MYNKIKSIFKNKIIENVQDIINNSYYYFYQDYSCKNIFGIKKDISSSEYLMLNTMFLEKKTYSLDAKQQSISEYLYGESSSPFKQDINFVVYSVNDEDETIVNKVLEDIYSNITIIKYMKFSVAFGLFDLTIKDMFQALSSDLGYNVFVNFGFLITKETKGEEIVSYINYCDKLESNEFTTLSDVVINANNKNIELIRLISKNVINKLKDLASYNEIVNVLFKNNLNVSLTSKLLYMHRGTVLNKIEQIKKLTTLDVQNFKDAYTLKILIDIEK